MTDTCKKLPFIRQSFSLEPGDSFERGTNGGSFSGSPSLKISKVIYQIVLGD